jgi:predicted  nucleic acid-binding Zn-ribbon protein
MSQIDARDEILRLEPLLDRMERIEALLDASQQRFADLERSLLAQSISIRGLSERAEAYDANVQRLIAAIERLCEQVPPPVPSTFEAQLEHAMKRSES